MAHSKSINQMRTQYNAIFNALRDKPGVSMFSSAIALSRLNRANYALEQYINNIKGCLQYQIDIAPYYAAIRSSASTREQCSLLYDIAYNRPYSGYADPKTLRPHY